MQAPFRRIMTISPPIPISAEAHSPYGEFLAELDEVERHKWLLSEREGVDVGFERALSSWSQEHRAIWREMRNSLQAATK